MLKLKGFVVVPENIEHGYQLFPASNCGCGIVELTGKSGADLIILRTQGKSNLHYMFIGSTAERALRELPRSALVLKSTS